MFGFLHLTHFPEPFSEFIHANGMDGTNGRIPLVKAECYFMAYLYHISISHRPTDIQYVDAAVMNKCCKGHSRANISSGRLPDPWGI